MTTHVFGPSGARVPHAPSARRLTVDGPCALSFAGQASDYLDELATLRSRGGRAGALVDALLDELDRFVRAMPREDSAFFTEGLDAKAWLSDASRRPTGRYLSSVPVSFPLIFVAQLGHYERLRDAGLSSVSPDFVRVAAGHSQGIMAAVTASLAGLSGDLLPIAKVFAPLGLLFALRMQQAWPVREPRAHAVASAQRAGHEPPTAMASVTGLLRHELDELLSRFGAGIECTLDNTLFRQVLSAEPERLERFREQLAAHAAEQHKARKERRVGGRVQDPQWQYLPVSAPFHSAAMAPAMERLYRDAEALGFRWQTSDLQIPVLDTERAVVLARTESLIERLVTLQCVRPVHWRAMCDAMVAMGAKAVLDCGPGDALSKLTHSNLRGTGVSIWPMSAERTLAALTSGEHARQEQAAPAYPSATRVEGRVDNAWTRLTKAPPIVLAGMTPTTVEAPIVAAAANAGFVAELAGGGQVTEAILRLRVEELREKLEPGRSFVFNALYLDPHLWKLHFGGSKPLIVRLAEEGYAISGVTVSAGVPPKEEAVQLWRTLNRAGLRINSLKPGNDRELKEALAIAAAVPDLAVIIQIEGGHAGGHHSWEDLDDLLLRHYPAVRAHSNVILAVGGGVGTPDRAAQYLDGTWATPYGSRPLPVDCVFIGTAAMACLEAMTSPSVKRALVAAKGTDRWIADGTFEGGVTSGRSQLDASVYYLDTSASRAGRLLDRYAGDERAVQTHRDEIVAALQKTARPYFGDVESMTYERWLSRLCELTAIGRRGRYDDGAWPDRSYRARFLEALRMAEARLCDRDAQFDSRFAEGDLDDPSTALAQLVERYPLARVERVHPEDALAFFSLCKTPGKPVNFVPRIDADVRRWFKADSLWAAHDDRFEADQVLALPGPRALAAIDRVDEPVGALLERFSRAMRERLPEGSPVERTFVSETLVATAADAASPDRWLARLSSLDDGPVCAMIEAPRSFDATSKRTALNPLRTLLAPTDGTRVTVVRGPDGRASFLRTEDREGRVRLTVTATQCTLRSYGPEGREAALDLALSFCDEGYLRHDRAQHLRAQRDFYQRMLFGRTLGEVSVFERAEASVTVTRAMIEAFAYATGDQPGRMSAHGQRAIAPIAMAFSLLWEPMFSALSGALPDVARLVHEELEVEAGPCWPLEDGVTLQTSATITRLDRSHDGTRLSIEGALDARDGRAAIVRSTFFIRESNAQPSRAHREALVFERRIEARDEAALTVLREQPWLRFERELTAPCTLVVRCERLAHEGSTATAEGVLETLDHQQVALISCVDDRAVREHPVRALCALLAERPREHALSAPRALLEATVTAPRSMESYALASGDRNPLHLDGPIAALAELPEPIVHGMWTASVAAHRALEAAQARPGTIRKLTARFEAPVALAEALRVSVEQRALCDGAPSLTAIVRAHADESRVVARATVELSAPKTAYVFPGQGIQRAAMGMQGYARSSAAKLVWDTADAHCRKALGFSLLRVVRENPTELTVRAERFAHPQGVLFLTQFTQVAMVVLAVAQVAELRAQGALVPDAMLAGHSLGEYSALTAIAAVVPLAAAIEVVYQRGLTMDRLVPRDALGRTPYAMRVIRPNLVGLDDDGLRALIDSCAREGEPIEIVNYNVRGRQYSITGDLRALDRLEATIVAKAGENNARRALVVVPGVDVPFHSTLLRDGVDRFRATLERALPAELDARPLVGRYIPNLTGRLFSLDRAEVARIVAETNSKPLAAMLTDWTDAPESAQRRARTLLIELLAFQFASPVRWIDTQELLFTQCQLDRCVEVGIAEQPTLMNMVNSSLAVLGLDAPRAMNSELHASECLGPAPITAPITAAQPAPVASKPAAPVASKPAAPVAQPAPVAHAAPVVAQPARKADDLAFTVRDGLRVLLALQAKVRIEQLRDDESVDELLGGNSARRNQLLADVAQEFGVNAIDGAHEMPLRALTETLSSRATGYGDFGRYLGPAIDQRVGAALAGARTSKSDVVEHLGAHWGLGAGRVRHVLALLALEARVGDSTRGGALSSRLPEGLSDRATATQWIDAAVALHGQHTGAQLAPVSAQSTGGAAVDSAALDALEARVFGADGALVRAGTTLLRAAGLDAVPSIEQAVTDERHARLDAVEREHDEAYLALTRGAFSADKHMALTSEPVWLRRDLAQAFYDLLAGDETASALSASLRARACTDEARAVCAALAQRAARLGRPEVSAQFTALATQPTERGQNTSRTVLVTGAGPGSIALALVERLLAAGDRVVVTTSRYSDERMDALRETYRAHARRGAELHVVALNQGSFEDVDALVEWLAAQGMLPELLFPFGALAETGTLLDVGPRSLATLRIQLVGVQRLIARLATKFAASDDTTARCHCVLPLSPNHGIFGGDGLYGESKAALEVLLSRWSSEQHAWGRYFTLVGARIGWVRGTGLMAANDTLAETLEREHGLRTFDTGEMADELLALCTDDKRAECERAPLLSDLTAGFAALGDLSSIANRARSTAENKRKSEAALATLRAELSTRTRPDATPRAKVTPALRTRVRAPVPTERALDALPALDHLDLDQLAVVVGYGEVSPWGSSRTRWSAEADERLSLDALRELAWMTGMVECDAAGALIDKATKKPVTALDLRRNYEPLLRKNAGIRLVVGAAMHGFDPAEQRRHSEVVVDEPMAFTVASAEHAERYRSADPEHIKLEATEGGAVRVRCERGARVRVSTTASLRRRVVGQVPDGWDATRYGVPKAMVEQVDRVTLYNLVATVEAFLAAGLEPEELYEHLHITRVATTQSSGIGGMQKLRRLYHDPMLDRERQSDVLQETLINVISGWMVQAYVGSYGPISSPVGACATAALSVAEALDMLATHRADFVVTGGCDDYNEEGAVGFSDMGATADSLDAEAKGISPHKLSRPNDRRRMGFVEAQGAGALLLCRASVALSMGLPVYGVIAYAASHSDGINASVPAPGQGILGAAAESHDGAERRAGACQFEARRSGVFALEAQRAQLTAALGQDAATRVIREGRASLAHTFYRGDSAISALRGSLAVFGLEADDVAFVSKHDTSTNANDSNESKLHARLASALGRTAHLPLPVISQKSLTGHSKGAAAAWQLIGALQAMQDGVVPANRSLEDVAPNLQRIAPLCFSDANVCAKDTILRAALVTSLGFGHVGAIVCVVHPYFFWRALTPAQRERYLPRAQQRLDQATARLRRVLASREPLYTRRNERPFVDKESSDAHHHHEAEVLLDADARRRGARFDVAPAPTRTTLS